MAKFRATVTLEERYETEESTGYADEKETVFAYKSAAQVSVEGSRVIVERVLNAVADAINSEEM